MSDNGVWEHSEAVIADHAECHHGKLPPPPHRRGRPATQAHAAQNNEKRSLFNTTQINVILALNTRLIQG